MNILEYNRTAWNEQVSSGNEWTKPVTPEQTARARDGQWELLLTPNKPVPREWYPSDLHGAKVLCLASGGGQQGPILAAAGADVTVYDYSDNQLAQDRMVAERDGLKIRTLQGDMADLDQLADGEFDLIFHPVSNVFVPDVLPVWREAARVLGDGGVLLAGFCNPVIYLFDLEAEEQGRLEVRNRIPYADLTGLSKERLERHMREQVPLEFGHTLEQQIQGQLAAGFVLAGFYEDHYGGTHLLDRYMNTYIATRAVKVSL